MSSTATAASAVNIYPITAGGAVDANYAISYTAGTLTVGQAALIITANNQNILYGDAIPVLTASYAGFINGDSRVSLATLPLLSSTAILGSAANTARSRLTGSRKQMARHRAGYRFMWAIIPLMLLQPRRMG